MFLNQENKADPLRGTTTDEGEALFNAVRQLATGHSFEAVLNVAVNLVVNTLRQQHARAYQAEGALDELHAKAKQLLLDLHYQPGRHGARKQGAFAFNQHIIIPKVD